MRKIKVQTGPTVAQEIMLVSLGVAKLAELGQLPIKRGQVPNYCELVGLWP